MQLRHVFSNPTFMTYGMIGLTTVILAALTVFDSADNNDNDNNTNNESYVSQLFGQTKGDSQKQEQQESEQQEEEYSEQKEEEALQEEQQQETGLISALTGGSYKNKKTKTKRNLKQFRRKTHHKK